MIDVYDTGVKLDLAGKPARKAPEPRDEYRVRLSASDLAHLIQIQQLRQFAQRQEPSRSTA